MKPIQTAAAAQSIEARAPMCYFCSSQDSMEPFQRPAPVFLLSRLIPRLRWRYCRTCTRHFVTFRRTVLSGR